MFVPHALLLRGTLYALWREDEKGLKDLQDVVNTPGIDRQVHCEDVTLSSREGTCKRKIEKGWGEGG